MSLADQGWSRAVLALRLLAIDPGLGGIVIRSRAGAVRDRLMPLLPHGSRRIHPAISDAALFGGLDLSATLAQGTLVREKGLLATEAPLILTMAERTTPALAARLATALDQSPTRVLVALDEGAAPDEGLDPKLTERLAFHADLSDCPMADAVISDPPDGTPTDPQTVAISDASISQIARIAAELGIDSLRAPLYAIRTARALAALAGRAAVDTQDIETACTLTLAHRATRMPEPATDDTPPPPPPETSQQASDDDAGLPDLPDELLLEAVRALLPDDLLLRLSDRKARGGKGSGTGAARRGNRRGRPLPSRAGRITDGARVDLIATLRAAAPWQTIRRRATGRDGLHIRPSDIHIRRYEEKSDRLLIFAVDASGSSALNRLAEAKGAVEILLSQAYARRDHVALVAFRGTDAELLLPPTRSLVQTKRRLAGLPGGGGTPLAAGLMAAHTQAEQARRRGMTPTIAILTDGRANIALDGSPDRKAAATDAQTVAKALRAAGTDSIVIDTGVRPERSLRNLAQVLDAIYLPMPRADATRLSQSVAAAMGD